jgi:hypothetical protein
MKRLTASIAVLTGLGVWAGCGPRGSADATMPTPSASAVHFASPAWRYALPAGWGFSQVRVATSAVAIGGRSGVIVLDSRSGRLRWRSSDSVAAMGIGTTLVYGTTTNAMVSRSLREGSRRWEHRGVCGVPRYGVPAGATVIVDNARDVVVGCAGAGLVRLDAASGNVLARSDAFQDQITQIVPLGACAYGVSGWSDGAILRFHAAVVDCKELSPIVPERDEAWILGSIDGNAVLGCCISTRDAQRPITIALVNLTTGTRSPEVELREPARDPALGCPNGRGSVPMLAGAQLYLAVDCALYRYGDVRSPSAAQLVVGGLADFPAFLSDGRVALRAHAAGAAFADEVVRVRDATLETLWSEPEAGWVTFGYDPDVPDVVTVLGTHQSTAGITLVRTSDGAHLVVSPTCSVVGSSDTLLVTICSTSTLVGHRYLQYAAAYRWPDAKRPATGQ